MIERKTIFSPDRLYRYTLWRQWDLQNRRFCMFVGLNPSTADEIQDDPTVRRCIRFAKDWGYGALCMMNIFAYRATDPKVMKAQADPVGPENDSYLLLIHSLADLSVAAWGTHGSYRGRETAVLKYLQGIHCLGKTFDGHPKHPLYLKADLKPVPYR